MSLLMAGIVCLELAHSDRNGKGQSTHWGENHDRENVLFEGTTSFTAPPKTPVKIEDHYM
jgi:hypothetical protein